MQTKMNVMVVLLLAAILCVQAGGCEISDKIGCIAGAPHYDRIGMVCDNDGLSNEMYCYYDENNNFMCGTSECSSTDQLIGLLYPSGHHQGQDVDEHSRAAKCANAPKDYAGDATYNTFDKGSATWCEDYDESRPAIKCARLKTKHDCYCDSTGVEECEWYSRDFCAAPNVAIYDVGMFFCISAFGILVIFSLVDYFRKRRSLEKNPEFFSRKVNYLRGTPDIVEGAGFMTNYKFFINAEFLLMKMIYGDWAHYLSKHEALLMFTCSLMYSMFMNAESQLMKERQGQGLLLFWAVTVPILIVKSLYFTIAKWDDRADVTCNYNCVKYLGKYSSWIFSGLLYILGIGFAASAMINIEVILNPKCYIFNFFLYGPILSFVLDFVTSSLKFWTLWQLVVVDIENKVKEDKDLVYRFYLFTFFSYVLWVGKPVKFDLNNKMADMGIEAKTSV